MNLKARTGGWKWLAVAGMAALLACAAPARADQEVTIFFNNFDSSTVGAPPSPWQLIYSGAGAGAQGISRDKAFSGKQSLKLLGKQGAPAVIERAFTTDVPVLGTSYWILISAANVKAAGATERPGFWCQRSESLWGTWYGSLLFDHATNKVLDETTRKPMADWTPGVWTPVRTLVDRVDMRVKIWVDGKLVADRPMTDRFHPEWIDAMALMAGPAGVPVYYDNVRVFVPGVQETGTFVLDEIDKLAARNELATASANQLKTPLVNALEKEDGGDLEGAIAGLATFKSTVTTWARHSRLLDQPPVLMMKDYLHMTRLADQMIRQLQDSL